MISRVFALLFMDFDRISPVCSIVFSFFLWFWNLQGTWRITQLVRGNLFPAAMFRFPWNLSWGYFEQTETHNGVWGCPQKPYPNHPRNSTMIRYWNPPGDARGAPILQETSGHPGWIRRSMSYHKSLPMFPKVLDGKSYPEHLIKSDKMPLITTIYWMLTKHQKKLDIVLESSHIHNIDVKITRGSGYRLLRPSRGSSVFWQIF